MKEWLVQKGLEKNLVEYPLTTDSKKLMNFYHNISILTHFANIGETFGLVLAEAMAAKLPIVTHITQPFKDTAQTELVNNEYNGFVAVDPHVYAKAVINLLSAPEKARHFGQNGYKKARTSYDVPIITRGLEDIFVNQAQLKGLV